MFLGTQYFRPPSPRPAEWDRDLRFMRDSGIELAKIWLNWSAVNPRPGAWDFALYDRFLDTAEAAEMPVLVQIMTEGAPLWLGRESPDLLYRETRYGRGHPLVGISPLSTGGFPGVCAHHPDGRRATEEFVARTARHLRGRTGIYGYDAWNEIWHFPCVCEHSQRAYHDFLAATYGGPAEVALAYGDMLITDLAELELPPPGTAAAFPVTLDVAAFRRQDAVDRMRWLTGILRREDPGRTVVGHGLDTPFGTRTDAPALAAEVDVWGASSYAGDSPNDPYGFDRAELRLVHELNITRDAAPGRRWWLAEHTAGAIFGGLGFSRRRERSTVKAVLAFGMGAEAALYWQWRAQGFADESPNFGIAEIDGGTSPEVDEVARLGHALQMHRDLLGSLEFPAQRVGVVWDIRVADHAEVTFDDLGVRHARGIYDALLQAGYDIRLLTLADVARDGVPEGLRALVLPAPFFDLEGLGENLARWVADGGTLVAGPFVQRWGTDHWASQQHPLPPLDAVFGAVHARHEYPADPTVHGLPGERMVETYRLAGAEALGHSEGEPALTRHRHGAGTAYLLGTFAGAPHYAHRTSALPDFLVGIFTEAGAPPEHIVPEGCILRAALSSAGPVLFAVNLGVTPAEVEVPWDGAAARDILAAEALPIVDGTLRFTLAADGARIILPIAG